MPTRPRLVGLMVLALLPLLAATVPGTAGPAGAAGTAEGEDLHLRRATDPDRTIVTDPDGRWLATLTDGARTVSLAGPGRTLTEVGTAAAVPTTTWVRVLPQPFNGTVDVAWLRSALADRSPDVLATGLKYVAGAPEVRDAAGLLLSNDASYGPLLADGSREEGSDWNDYQGVVATYGETVDRPELDQAGALDCSGFMRMLWGVRLGLPLSLRPTGTTLPRRAFEMLDSAPGTVVVANTGKQVRDLSRIAPGDLVFFDAATDDGAAIDHVGMYLGLDTAGRHRFVSSRKSADGPTMGDLRGASLLDGRGLYAKGFRAVRRL